MAVIFPRWTNRIPIFIALTAPIVVVCITFAIWYWFSPKFTDVGYQPQQPIPFSHQLHAGNLGLDCRYCHNTVERASHAAIPPTATCWGCHGSDKGAIGIDAATSEPKRSLFPLHESFQNDTPVEWVKVHMLPDYAYFNHSIHIDAGVGCASCHGRVDQMEVVRQDQPLSMSWCLDCHRDPEMNLRPDDVSPTQMDWTYDKADKSQREQIALKADNVNPPEHCSGCHR